MERRGYFTQEELTASDTARRRGIDNTPTPEVAEHLRELTEMVLDPLRAAWGKPVRVTSGYRCDALNRAVGGASTSAHLRGYAADLQSADFGAFAAFTARWLKQTGTRFDQCLIETNRRTGAKWVHIGLYNNAGQQRGIITNMTV